LLVSIWLSTGTGGHAHRPSVTATVFSDDGGKTWGIGEIAVPNTPEWVNPNETVAVELADGKVMLNARSESKPQRRLITTSSDGAKGWSTPRFDDGLFEPVCFASLIRVRDERTLVFSNPDPETKKRDRKNLTLKVSEDDGVTWPVSRVLEPDRAGYSDLAQLSDGTLLCFYERASSEGAADLKAGVLTLARIPLNWLREGRR
jgi:sialidase-1